MKSTDIRRQCCPACHHVVSQCTDLTGEEIAKLGALCVCLYCGSFLLLGKRGLRVLSQRAVAALPDRVRITMQRMRRAAAEVQAHGVRAHVRRTLCSS